MPLEDPTQTTPPSNSVFAFFRRLNSVLFAAFEFILRSIIAILTSLVKIIRATGIALGVIFAALALLLFAFFYAADLPSSENFQNFREESFGILSDWVEVEFHEIKENAAIWRGENIDSVESEENISGEEDSKNEEDGVVDLDSEKE